MNFNNQRKPLDDPRVRAIRLGVSKQALIVANSGAYDTYMSYALRGYLAAGDYARLSRGQG